MQAISSLFGCHTGGRGPMLLPVLLTLLLLATGVTPMVAHAAGDPKAREIMQAVNDRDDGDNSTMNLEMVLIDRRGNKRERQIRMMRKDFGKDTYVVSFFLAPADVKDTGFLTYDYDAPGKDDDQWLYLPALRKSKRIASSDKSGKFMGSDFFYSDMSRPDLDDFTYEIMKEAEVDGAKVWIIEATPISEEVADETGYSKSELWVRQDNHIIVRAKRWVKEDRTVKYMQVNKLEQIDGIWIATEMQMVTKQGRDTVHATVLKFSDIKFNQSLDEDLFTLRRLEKGA
jgi:outer membrane lipoprotein-sorting protein